jgi:DNA repair exonuclease SbcCD ATPase subunit
MRPLSEQQRAQTLETAELQGLRDHLLASKEKIYHQYEAADNFTQRLLGDFFQIENLVERGEAFLFKAQTIRNYLASEDHEKIQQDIASLQEKIRNIHDDFSQQQYQQALETRHKHLETLQDIQRMYERLVSQVTNIWMSLDSIYSRMMKLKTSDYSPGSAESKQVSGQLSQLLEDVEQLDTTLNEHLALSD